MDNEYRIALKYLPLAVKEMKNQGQTRKQVINHFLGKKVNVFKIIWKRHNPKKDYKEFIKQYINEHY